jgi:lipoprotein-anchoring transpeptidase ErfK/SrfK
MTAGSPARTATLIATATGSTVSSYDAPDDRGVQPSNVFSNPWFVHDGFADKGFVDGSIVDDRAVAVPLVFLVVDRRGDGWLQVWLPIRPNGATGWIRDSEVTLTTTAYRIVVMLGERRLVVYDGYRVIFAGAVAIGAPATPTPTGRYFLRVLLRAPDPDAGYGPYAYGLSGYSPTLTAFHGGDAEVGIHGNDDASVLGAEVTHGCVRMSNDAITKLAAMLPLGTPVDILA